MGNHMTLIRQLGAPPLIRSATNPVPLVQASPPPSVADDLGYDPDILGYSTDTMGYGN